MWGVFQLWLFLHILGAIVAFGFGFTAPIFGRASAAEPQHGNWYLRAAKQVSNVVLVPVALSMVVTGTLLVMTSGGMQRFQELWLALSLVLYVIALLIIFLVQRPTVDRLIALTASPPGPDGPPPGLRDLVRRTQLAGMALGLLVVVIVGLMVWKPTLG